jgi:hypothetical protein
VISRLPDRTDTDLGNLVRNLLDRVYPGPEALCTQVSAFADQVVDDIQAPARCERGCGRPWHGIAVTVRLEMMAVRGEADPDYCYFQDQSPVLCPAPGFVGPVQPASTVVFEVVAHAAGGDE